MRTILNVLCLCAWALLLTACKGEPKEVVDIPFDPPAPGLIAIEAPKYFVMGEPTEIKLHLSGPESFSATGDLYFYTDNASNSFQKINLNPLKLDPTSPQVVIPIEAPPLASAQAAVAIRIKFVWNDNNNYSRQTVSEARIIYPTALTAGPTETIKGGAEKILSASQNTLLEAIEAGGAEFSWQQNEGPAVTLTQLSGRAVQFTAPMVTEVTKLRFTVTRTIKNTRISNQAEKVLFIIPSSQWAKIIKTFDNDTIIVRDDNIAIVNPKPRKLGFAFKLHRPLAEIKDMAYLGDGRVISLYLDGTLDLLTLNSNGTYRLPYKDQTKSPILPGTYYTERYFYTANNIERINGLNHDGIWEAKIRWQPGTLSDSFYTIGARDGEYTTISDYGVSPELSWSGQLSGKLQYKRSINSFDYIDSTSFSLSDVKAYGFAANGKISPSKIGYVLNSGLPGIIEYGMDSTNAVQPIVRNTILESIPFDYGLIAIHLFQGDIYLLDERGQVGRYHDKKWEPIDYLRDITHLGDEFFIDKDGTGGILWNDLDLSNYDQQAEANLINSKNIPFHTLENLQ
ncbi:MAG: hypothetical protein U1F46_10360 [Marinagarivorans sp.]